MHELSGEQDCGDEASAVSGGHRAGRSCGCAPGGDDLAQMIASIKCLAEEVAELRHEQARFQDRAQGYEDAIRRLSAEREELRHDQVRQLLAPAFKALAKLYRQAGELGDRAEQEDLFTVAKDFRFLMDEIGDLLSDFDVAPVDAQPGDPVEPRLHMVVSTVATTDPMADRTIARVIQQGYTYVGSSRPLQAAKVTAHKFIGEEDSVLPPGSE